jgi:maltooligosyltrehalose trehalohydrolase
MPFGAEVRDEARDDGSVRFRLWAPKANRVTLCEYETNRRWSLTALDQGWFELVTRDVGPGFRYHFQIDDDAKVPDPASRFQPLDVHGPSEVINPADFDWQNFDGREKDWQGRPWIGRPWEEAVIYELHVGAFTSEGTFRAVEQKLDYLVDLGITAIELMPVSDFPGRRNWGYDGVLPYAPDSSYGRPEDLKHLIQAAHSKGLMVFLDVVYNHFGPEGNYIRAYAPQFFTDRHKTPWGDAINFDGPDSRTVRDFFIHNALYWLEEYQFDGLRLDAVHAIIDDSTPDIITELAQAVRQKIGGSEFGEDGSEERHVHLILENADNIARYLRRDSQNNIQLYDAQWNDDIHHVFHVLITGESDGYYSDYARQPIHHLCRCLSEGFAYQGDYSEFHTAQRGEPSSDLPPSAFISFLQNHDQVGNRALGERIATLARPEALKAAMEVLLLAPSPPLLFMGEEFGATSPFYFFCDFHGELAAAVTDGRRNEFAAFDKFKSAATRERIPDPNAEKTYLESKLDWNKQDWNSLSQPTHADWLRLYRELLSIRRRVIVPIVNEITGVRANSCDEQSRSLSIDWILKDGSRLKLRTNFDGEWLAIPIDASGQEFYISNEATASNALPPWSVRWSLGK